MTAFIAAIVASISELAVTANINDAASCGNDEDGCDHLSPPFKMILAAIAAILWATVAFVTFQSYRGKTVNVSKTTTTPSISKNSRNSNSNNNNNDASSAV